MYKISIPITTQTLEDYGTEIYLKQLKQIGADRIFLCPASNRQLWNNYNREISRLKKYISLFKNEGYEVGIWLWTFLYDKPSDFTYMVSPEGNESNSNVCPTDLEYRKIMGQFIEDAGRLKVDLIMFDDDYRYGFIDIGLGCFCKNHLDMIQKKSNESIDRKSLVQNILYGKPNEYRKAFLQANGESLINFAVDMRRHLDKVNPECRMGFCSCITSWDFDGTTPDMIAKALAGNTKPFYRLIGAPYWANDRNWGNRLADVIEMEKLESSLREDDNIEIFSECDAFPRPRYKVPAAYTEGFDTALRAAGCTDGILKYIIDYTSHPLTETGYLKAHLRNNGLYRKISEMFDGKVECGIKVWFKPDKFRDMNINEDIHGNTDKLTDYDFPKSARLLTACSIPSAYTVNPPCGIAFGEDIKAVPPENQSGLIIDLCAAQILMKKGIDVGIDLIGDRITTNIEKYKNGNKFSFCGSISARNCILKKNAIIESSFQVNDFEYPASFRYQNKKGQKFLVLCFDGYKCQEDLYRQYGRQDLLIDNYKWLCGENIPVYSKGNPDLYIQLKFKDNIFAIGLWNFSPDEIEKPILTIQDKCTILSTLNCTAELSGNNIILSRIEAFGVAFIEIELI